MNVKKTYLQVTSVNIDHLSFRLHFIGIDELTSMSLWEGVVSDDNLKCPVSLAVIYHMITLTYRITSFFFLVALSPFSTPLKSSKNGAGDPSVGAGIPSWEDTKCTHKSST